MAPLNGLDMLLAAIIYRDEIIAWIDEHMPDSERRRWR